MVNCVQQQKSGKLVWCIVPECKEPQARTTRRRSLLQRASVKLRAGIVRFLHKCASKTNSPQTVRPPLVPWSFPPTSCGKRRLVRASSGLCCPVLPQSPVPSPSQSSSPGVFHQSLTPPQGSGPKKPNGRTVVVYQY